MSSLPTVLAHAGPGASWQALVTVLAVLVAVLFLLAVGGAVRITQPGDLVLPLSGVVIVSSLGTSASATFSDQVGWALPIGVVALVALVLYSTMPDDWALVSPWTGGVVAVAVIAAVALQSPLTRALHPPPIEFDPSALPAVDDLSIQIIQPGDQEQVASPVTLEVQVTGGTVGAPGLEFTSDPPADPEELGRLRLLDGATVLDVEPEEACSTQAPCTTLTYQLDLTPGTHQILVEFLTSDGSTFRRSVFDLVLIEVG